MNRMSWKELPLVTAAGRFAGEHRLEIDTGTKAL